jgi:phosphotransferase system HPr (HPr) family protein
VTEQVFELTVTDPIGLHARPVGEIVKLVKQAEVSAALRRPGGASFSANSPLKLLSMKVKAGETVELVIETDRAELAAELAEAIGKLVAGD